MLLRLMPRAAMLALLIHMRSARAANRNHSSSVAQMADESNTYQLKQDACCVCNSTAASAYDLRSILKLSVASPQAHASTPRKRWCCSSGKFHRQFDVELISQQAGSRAYTCRAHTQHSTGIVRQCFCLCPMYPGNHCIVSCCNVNSWFVTVSQTG